MRLAAPEDPLTQREWRVLTYLTLYEMRYGMTPTFLELAIHFKVSRSTVRAWLNRLRLKGYVRWHEGQVRSIKVVKLPPEEMCTT